MTVSQPSGNKGGRVHGWLPAGLVLLAVPPMLFKAQVLGLYELTAHAGEGTELAGFGFLIFSPLVVPFLILSVAVGLVASRAVYRRSSYKLG